MIRPTGLVDPEIVVRPVEGQVDDLVEEIRKCAESGERVLVTTLTKRMSEELTDYLLSLDIRVRYLHSDIDALERVEILRGLRLGDFDALVGINLLREGLDLPEVSLVAVCDADKEGFLRSERSLIQTAGRAARHVSGRVIFYADQVTDSMRRAMDETNAVASSSSRTTRSTASRRAASSSRSTKSPFRPRSPTRGARRRRRGHRSGGAVGCTGGRHRGRDAARSARLNFEKAASLRDRLDEIRLSLAATENRTAPRRWRGKGNE